MGSKLAGLPDSVCFGDDFELDVRAYELRSAGIPLKLKPITMELLLLLVEHRGELVTRGQIVERIWGKAVFLDTDNGINGAVSRIRQVLRDDPEQPRFVQTVTGKGYRFIAAVKTSGASALPIAPDEAAIPASEPFIHKSLTVTERHGTRLRTSVLAVVIVVLAASGAYFEWLRPRVRPQAMVRRTMLAVLPFENLTGDAGQDYFSDGLTEEMISRLGHVDPRRIGVIARTSVMHYKHSSVPLDQIGRELGVQYVLEGSVRRDAAKVRVTAQLIQVKDQTHLWARHYDREPTGVLALQEEIAREISDEIQVALGDHLPAPPTIQLSSPEDYEAYDLYLKGEYFWNTRTVNGLQRAIDYFQQAIAKDSNYARAYAGLADAYALIGGYAVTPQTEFMSKARTAALHAVELDESLPEAHTALALIVQNYDRDWQTAEKEYRRAIELNPNYATAHHWYAEHLAFRGRFDEALRESERARQLDPLSLIIAADKGVILYYSRDYDAAIAQFRAVREMDPAFLRAGMIRQVYAQKEMFAEILAEDENLRRDLGDAVWIWSEMAYVYGRTGQPALARRALAKTEQWNRRHPADPVMFVMAYIGMGDKDQAFFWLEKAFAQHSNAMVTLKVDPLYDPLRSDPRFQDLLRRAGLAP